MRSIVAAGSLLVLNGAVAVAQSPMTIDIPFTFKTPGATMQPGKYAVTHIYTGTSTNYYSWRHLDTGKAVVVVAGNRVERKAEDNLKPEVTFECIGELCALRAIYEPFTTVGHALPTMLKAGRAGGQQIAEIRIPAVR
jgi:hypothetical protein